MPTLHEGPISKRPAVNDSVDILLGDWLELVRNYTVPPGFILLGATFFYDRTILATPGQSRLVFWALTWIAFFYALLSAIRFTRRRFLTWKKRWVREFLWVLSFGILFTTALNIFTIAARIADHQHLPAATAKTNPSQVENPPKP